MYCKDCGKIVPDGAAFCPACGAKCAENGTSRSSADETRDAARRAFFEEEEKKCKNNMLTAKICIVVVLLVAGLMSITQFSAGKTLVGGVEIIAGLIGALIFALMNDAAGKKLAALRKEQLFPDKK